MNIKQTTTIHKPARPHPSLAVYARLVRAAESVTQRSHRQLSAHDLTISQFGVLEALMHLGPLSQKQLGEKILKTSGNMTLVIDNLQKRGLVERAQCAEDRRVTLVSLTVKGAQLIEEIFPAQAEAIEKEMAVLSGEEQWQLAQYCRKLERKQ